MSVALEGSPFEGAANPFGAPLFYREETSSTMEDAREIASAYSERGELPPHGAVAIAGRQTAGRGRLPGRSWDAPAGESLLCTVILRGAPPSALTLRAGLAAAKTFDSFLEPAGKGRVQVKWPNDVLYKGRKLSGILCEAAGELTLVGAGLNIRQRAFPQELEGKAASLALILGEGEGGEPSLSLALERFLFFLKEAFGGGYPWREELTRRLFMLDEEVQFALGASEGGGELARGILRGLDEDGALLLETEGQLRALYSGELLAF